MLTAVQAVYFNLSSVVGEGRITDGSHDNYDCVRTASISMRHKVLVLTLRQVEESAYVSLVVSYTPEEVITRHVSTLKKWIGRQAGRQAGR